jgi:hypothetical protein
MDRLNGAGAALQVGQPFAGGYFAGRYFLGAEERALVVADRSATFAGQWWDRDGPRPNIRGAQHYMDGMANTQAMAEAGSAAAAKVLRMRIGGVGGWHIPARDELLVMQVNLLQVDDFGRDGAQGFGDLRSSGEYWSSTQKNAGSAWNLHMLPWCVPSTNWGFKEKMIRPVRSVPIIREPDATDLPDEGRIVGRIDLVSLGNNQIEAVLDRFINEDSGRFYGRTDDLIGELRALAGMTGVAND